ncbi:nucleotide disphospho-sugar-binding domain-containing protein [Actinophytocola sp.]|uniref:nucleotide disphospho-sugar-binding domain-containing protein n=1 Tax=Actinophytocola sp. TaxID=1872138 RepID=UPI002D7F3116|nr:nucleotide disphospho-sugar-binding domain-containing protein [Actinophytocola sp.]HET9144249.1 nucleotide disphospho-sugar-binding domain-containing protein [Actinophytocola sp.]
MRVLFTCHGGMPHLFPMVPLAWAFRSAGHEVRIASQARILDALMHTGLPVVEISRTPEWTEEERAETIRKIYQQDPLPAGWTGDLSVLSEEQRAYQEFIGRRMIRIAEAMVDELTAFGRRWRPDLVVYDAEAFAGPVVAEQLGVPGVRHLFGTATVPRTELDATGAPLPEYVRLFQDRGMRARLTAAATVDPTPPSMRLEHDPGRLAVRYVPYNGAGQLPAWLLRPRYRPRVCVTWGHTAATIGDAATHPFRDAIGALSGMDVEIVVITTPAQLELLGAELRGGVHAAASVPLHLVLPHCDVLVQQGGDGTTLTAASAGVPQLAISRKPDAEMAPGRLAAVGAGIHLRYQELRQDPARAQVIRDAVGRLLREDGYRAAARRLRQEIERQPAPAEVVPALARLAPDGPS